MKTPGFRGFRCFWRIWSGKFLGFGAGFIDFYNLIAYPYRFLD